MNNQYVQPKISLKAFNCPYCGAFSHHNWGEFFIGYINGTVQTQLRSCICSHCYEISIWKNGNMIYPNIRIAPLPNTDLPEDIIRDYEEAGDILNKSPRGAAALLRLCVQKLCKHLGESGNNINEDIGKLVAKGLPVQIQRALDIVRVVGNNAVHPGQIDLVDDVETASKLFVLINMVADTLITQPKELEKQFNLLPEGQKKGIELRDKKQNQ